MPRLIWNMRGMQARGMAEHYIKHLNEYALANGMEPTAKVQMETDYFYLAMMDVEEEDAEKAIAALKPQEVI